MFNWRVIFEITTLPINSSKRVCVCLFACSLACLFVCPWNVQRPMFLCICCNCPHFRLGIGTLALYKNGWCCIFPYICQISGCKTLVIMSCHPQLFFFSPCFFCPEEWPIVSGWLEAETWPMQKSQDSPHFYDDNVGQGNIPMVLVETNIAIENGHL